jgi:Protein of unknown function (DUF3592)
MELDINGTIVAQPSADDIVRALAAASFPDDWYIALENEAGASLDAQAQSDGTFTLSYGDDKRRRPQTVDAATVKAVYLEFLAGAAGGQPDSQAHEAPRPKFVPDTRPLRGRSGDRPPLPAIIVITVITVLAWLPLAIEHWSPGTVAGYIPYAKSNLFWVGLIFFPMVALLVVAAVSKLVQFRAAKSWVQTSGRILSAGIDVRHHQFSGEPETVKNVPALRYEFLAGARKVIGSRIGIGDDAGGANLEATLARYPVGANVTVYYDADDPTQCVLERDGLQGITKGELVGGCASGLAILALFGGTIYWLFTRGPDFIARHFPKAASNPQPAILSFCFGLGALMLFFAARRYSKQAANWPSVRGRIVDSRVEAYQERVDKRWTTLHRPVVEYAYVVHGHKLHGNQIKLMTQISGSESMAARTVAKYPAESAVDVHYDPADPTNAALENPSGAAWIAAVVALVFFAASAWLLGVFG